MRPGDSSEAGTPGVPGAESGRRAVADVGAPASPACSEVDLRVRLFGEFEVRIDGALVPKWHGRLARSIMAFLLLQGQCVPRDRLMELFWPDVDPKSAQNRLRVAISALRRSIRAVSDQPVIEFRGGNYDVARRCRVRLDVVEFESHARSAREAEARHELADALHHYRRAVEHHRGELLADLAYEEWTLLPREALRVSHLECLSRAASLHLRRGEHGECISLAWRILGADPAREDAHRLIIRCHAARGELYQARRQFDVCRRELHETLGVEPSPATLELIGSIDRSR